MTGEKRKSGLEEVFVSKFKPGAFQELNHVFTIVAIMAKVFYICHCGSTISVMKPIF